MRPRRTTLLRMAMLLLAACLLCTSCGSGVNMYKHKRNTDCGC